VVPFVLLAKKNSLSCEALERQAENELPTNLPVSEKL
jgi:hypothetical protein